MVQYVWAGRIILRGKCRPLFYPGNRVTHIEGGTVTKAISHLSARFQCDLCDDYTCETHDNGVFKHIAISPNAEGKHFAGRLSGLTVIVGEIMAICPACFKQAPPDIGMLYFEQDDAGMIDVPSISPVA